MKIVYYLFKVPPAQRESDFKCLQRCGEVGKTLMDGDKGLKGAKKLGTRKDIKKRVKFQNVWYLI